MFLCQECLPTEKMYPIHNCPESMIDSFHSLQVFISSIDILNLMPYDPSFTFHTLQNSPKNYLPKSKNCFDSHFRLCL